MSRRARHHLRVRNARLSPLDTSSFGDAVSFWSSDASASPLEKRAGLAVVPCTPEGAVDGPGYALTVPYTQLIDQMELLACLTAYTLARADGEHAPLVYTDSEGARRVLGVLQRGVKPRWLLPMLADMSKALGDHLHSVRLHVLPRCLNEAMRAVDKLARRQYDPHEEWVLLEFERLLTTAKGLPA